MHACQERIEDLVWLAAGQDLTAKQEKELAELEAEVEAIRGEVRKSARQRAEEHQVRVRAAELREAEYKSEQEWELVPDKGEQEWEVVSFASTKFEWER